MTGHSWTVDSLMLTPWLMVIQAVLNRAGSVSHQDTQALPRVSCLLSLCNESPSFVLLWTVSYTCLLTKFTCRLFGFCGELMEAPFQVERPTAWKAILSSWTQRAAQEASTPSVLSTLIWRKTAWLEVQGTTDPVWPWTTMIVSGSSSKSLPSEAFCHTSRRTSGSSTTRYGFTS